MARVLEKQKWRIVAKTSIEKTNMNELSECKDISVAYKGSSEDSDSIEAHYLSKQMTHSVNVKSLFPEPSLRLLNSLINKMSMMTERGVIYRLIKCTSTHQVYFGYCHFCMFNLPIVEVNDGLLMWHYFLETPASFQVACWLHLTSSILKEEMICPLWNNTIWIWIWLSYLQCFC